MSGLPQDLESRLKAGAPAGFTLQSKTDAKGVTTAWCTLADKADLKGAAKVLKELGARLSTITALQHKPAKPAKAKEGEPPPPPPEEPPHRIAYHFDMDGDTLTLHVLLPHGQAVVDSLTPFYRNADWNERELMELYSVRVKDHPDPRRLFLDESVDGAALERLIPFSTLVNSADTKTLWEKIMVAKGGAQ